MSGCFGSSGTERPRQAPLHRTLPLLTVPHEVRPASAAGARAVGVHRCHATRGQPHKRGGAHAELFPDSPCHMRPAPHAQLAFPCLPHYAGLVTGSSYGRGEKHAPTPQVCAYPASMRLSRKCAPTSQAPLCPTSMRLPRKRPYATRGLPHKCAPAPQARAYPTEA